MLTSHEDDGVVHVSIDCPPLNLVDGNFLRDLIQMLPGWEQDESVKVVVFRSADPDFFLMHGDVQMMAETPAAEYQPVTRPNIAASTFLRISKAPFVTIGAIDGAARGGGCEFLSALDIRIGTPRVVIGQPEVALGILPGAGGTVRWPRIAGRAAALELMLTARDVDAAERRHEHEIPSGDADVGGKRRPFCADSFLDHLDEQFIAATENVLDRRLDTRASAGARAAARMSAA